MKPEDTLDNIAFNKGRLAAKRLARTFGMSSNNPCNCEQSLTLIAELEVATFRLETANTELAKYKADVAEVAGQFMVPMPMPNTDIAKIMIVNNILKREREDLECQIRTLQQEVNTLRLGA